METRIRKNLRKFMNGCSGGTSTQSSPDSAETEISGRVRRVDVFVRKKETSKNFNSSFLIQIVLEKSLKNITFKNFSKLKIDMHQGVWMGRGYRGS